MGERALLSRGTGTTEQGRLGVCPFLRRVVASRAASIQAYCQGVRDGRLRIPCVAVFREFCSTGRYPECPVYLSRIHQGGLEGEVS